VFKWVGLGAVGVFVLIQAVPYGWSHSNPAVTANAPWPSAEAESLARAACYDCHSNETDWPVYSYVAPMSWLVRRDVESGRDELNFSEWDHDGDAHDAAHEIEDGTMPPRTYTLMHPDARLSDEAEAALIAALETMDDRGGESDD
jgi:Haem-binding domain